MREEFVFCYYFLSLFDYNLLYHIFEAVSNLLFIKLVPLDEFESSPVQILSLAPLPVGLQRHVGCGSRLCSYDKGIWAPYDTTSPSRNIIIKPNRIGRFELPLQEWTPVPSPLGYILFLFGCGGSLFCHHLTTIPPIVDQYVCARQAAKQWSTYIEWRWYRLSWISLTFNLYTLSFELFKF